MSQHPIEGLMDVTLEKIKSMVDSNTIIGNPINMADGTLVLPISKGTFGRGFSQQDDEGPVRRRRRCGCFHPARGFPGGKRRQRAHAAACRYLQQCRPRHWYAAGHG